jgi:flagellar biogenesis protein FliO
MLWACTGYGVPLLRTPELQLLLRLRPGSSKSASPGRAGEGRRTAAPWAVLACGVPLLLLGALPAAHAQLSSERSRTADLPVAGTTSGASTSPGTVRPTPAATTVQPNNPATSAARPASVRRQAAAVTDPEARPLKPYRAPPAAAEPEIGGSLFLGVLGKLVFVIALMFVCAAGWKKLQNVIPQHASGAVGGLQLISTLPLGAQRCLHVVMAGGRQLLIASTPQSITFLASLDEAITDLYAPAYEQSASASGRAAPAQRADADWQDGPATTEDRFEELLLRLRRLEGQQARRGAAPSEEPAEARSRNLTSGPSTSQLLGAAGPRRNHPSATSREEDAEAGSTLAPGALFRTAGGGRIERHA